MHLHYRRNEQQMHRPREGRQGVWTPLKNHKAEGLLQYWFGSPGKLQNYQASIQCWAIIGPPANLDSRSPHQTNNNKHVRVDLDPSDKTFCIRANTK